MKLPFGILLATAAASAGIASAAVTATLDYTASADPDGGADMLWEDSLNPAGDHPFELTDVTYDGSPVGAPSGVTGVYSFNGTTSVAKFGATKNIENIPGGNPTGQSATFEMVFRTDSVTNQAILWEFGGSGAGISMTLNNGVVQFYDSKTGSGALATATVALGWFYHAVGVIDFAADELSLYLNGTRQGSPVFTNATDWAGNDGGTDGSIDGQSGNTVGGQNGGPISSYGLFDGDVAAFRLYKNQVASQTDVNALFAATGIVVPEPSTLGLLLIAGLGLLRRKR